jgi:TPR repeat protein
MDPKTQAAEGDWLSLEEQGDVESLLALARAYRSGDADRPKDLRACFEAYLSAARLGSAEASYAVALFYFAGGVVERDPQAALPHLRAAADAGHVQARVYVANLYESGNHYKQDAEKASVWYRSAARAAQIDFAPDSEAYTQALARLGAGRHLGSLDATERAGAAKRARTLGFVSPSEPDAARISLDPRVAPVDAASPSGATPAPQDVGDAARQAKLAALERQAKPRAPSRLTVSEGLTAFAFALLFLAAGAGAGFAAERAALALVLAKGQPLPVLGHHPEFIMPLGVVLVGLVPSFLYYKAKTVMRATAFGLFGAGLGWVFWGTELLRFAMSRALQTTVFGSGLFLLCALALGLVGGAKQKPRPEDAKL